MSLTSFLRINFYSGFLGTLISMPLLYLAEALRSRGQSELLHLTFVDLAMMIVAPLIAGLVFVLTGLLAFPLIRALQNKGILKDVL